MAAPAHLRVLAQAFARFVLLPLALHLCLELPPPRNLLGGQGERRPRPLQVMRWVGLRVRVWVRARGGRVDVGLEGWGDGHTQGPG